MKKFILFLLFSSLFGFQLTQGQIGGGCQGFPDPCFHYDCSGVVLNAIGGVESAAGVICNGQLVTFINNSTPANLVDSTIIFWGDGAVDRVAGLQSVQHVYNIQPDTCWDGTVCLSWGVKHNCPGGGYNFTCVQTQLFIITDPLPGFGLYPDPVCQGDTVAFTNTSCPQPFPTSWLWDFGDGTFSTEESPVHFFPGVGCHTVKMTVSVYVPGESIPCLSRTAIGQVCVLATPVAQAAFDIAPGEPLCAPETLKIINLSQHVDSYIWTVMPFLGVSYADNTSQYSSQPCFVFTQAGTYSLHLLGKGCGESVWDTVITVVKAPGITLDEISDYCQEAMLIPAALPNYNPAPQPFADQVSWAFYGGSPASAIGHFPTQAVHWDIPGNSFFVTVLDSNVCGVSKDTQYFNINAPVDLVLDPLSPLCHSEAPVTLGANVNATWSGQGVVNGNQFDPESVPPGSTITLTASYGQDLCAVSESITVTVLGINLNAGADQSVCGSASPAFNLPEPTEQGGIYVVDGTDTLSGDVFNPADFGGGSHEVAYFLLDDDGCLNSDALMVTVYGLPDAIPNIPTGGCVNELLTFSVPSSAGLCSAKWVFENGVVKTGLSVNQSFTSVGGETVMLVMESCAGGCIDTSYATLTISQPPFGVEFAALNPLEGCGETMPIAFENQSETFGNPDDVTYRWTSNCPGYELEEGFAPPEYVFPQDDDGDAIYLVKLEAENGCGILSKTVEVIVHPVPKAVVGLPLNSGCSPMVLENYAVIVTGKPTVFGWWLDGVQISTDSLLQSITLFAYPTLPRTYELTFIAANDCGADTVSQTITVSPVDYAAFANQDTNQVCLGFDTLHFISYPPPGCWSWWKHQGNLLLWGGDTLLFQPSQAGADSLILYVSNGCGYDSLVVNFTAHDKPETSLAASTFNCLGTAFVVVNNSTSAIPTDVAWGDSSFPSTPLTLQHTYAEPGWYWVEVTLRDTLTFCYARDSVQVEVRPLPVPSLAVSDTNGCPPLIANFQNNSTGGEYFTWYFGTGDTSHDPNPVYTYDSTGIYSVLLVAEDALGCSASTVFNAIVVHPIPVPDFEIIPESTCGLPVEMQVENHSQGGLDFTFLTDMGVTSQATNPTFTFSTPGDHWVRQVLTNQFQCADTLLKTFRTYHQPVADFEAVTEVCENEGVRFFNHSQHVNGYLYYFGDGTSSEIAEPSHIYTEAGTYSPTLVASNEGVCFDTLTLQDLIWVKPSTHSDFSWSEKTDPTPAGIVVFQNESAGATGYLWLFGDGDSTTIAYPEHRYEGNGDKTVMLLAYNDWGCVDTAMQVVPLTRFLGLFMPDALAPESSEDESRVFLPKGVGLTEYKVSVFSAQGELLWQSSQLDGEGQPTEAWDGAFRGEVVPQGAYAWAVEAAFLSGKKVRREGSVTVLR